MIEFKYVNKCLEEDGRSGIWQVPLEAATEEASGNVRSTPTAFPVIVPLTAA